MVRKFNPDGAPAPHFYSHGAEVQAGARMLFVSGQVGQRADGSLAEGMTEQTRVAAANLEKVLAGAGMSFDDVARFRFFLTDPSLMGEFAQGAAGMLRTPPAATTLVYVKALATPEMLVEIEAVAAK